MKPQDTQSSRASEVKCGGDSSRGLATPLHLEICSFFPFSGFKPQQLSTNSRAIVFPNWIDSVLE